MPGVGRPTRRVGLGVSTAGGLSYEPHAWAGELGADTPATICLRLSRELLRALTSGSLSLPLADPPGVEEDTWADGTPVTEDETARTLVRDGGVAHLLTQACGEIDAAIDDLGGVVVPKLGRVAPCDATWVTFTRSLRCETASDVLTLVGASERAMRVADTDADEAPTLALRAYIPHMEATGEFRAFVRGGVVALSQRDTCIASNFGQREMDRVVQVVCAHFRAVVEKACAAYDEGDGYVYDVFVDRRWAVTVMDVAPWRGGTDARLFSWEELEEAPWMTSGSGRAQLRCVSEASGIRPAQSLYDAMPVELRNAGSGDALADAARRLHDVQLGERSGNEADSEASGTSSEEDEARHQ